MMKKISFAIPVFNNQGSLKPTYISIVELFSNQLKDYEFEIWFTNDGSTDNSLFELHEIRKKDKRVKVINFSKNFGQVAATIAAQRSAVGDAVVTISADQQDPIDKVFNMVVAWEKGNDIVICYRNKREKGFLNSITSRIHYTILRAHTSSMMPLGGFDYYLLDRKPLTSLNSINDSIRGLPYDIFSLGYGIYLIPYSRGIRSAGTSQYSLYKRLRDFWNAFISFSNWPIRLMGVLGFIFFISSIIYSFSITYAWLTKNTPFEGWAPLMILILLIGGILMLMFSIVGEYILRIYTEVKKRPNYIIKDKFE